VRFSSRELDGMTWQSKVTTPLSLRRRLDRAAPCRPIDAHYQAIRVAMKGVFHELGLAA
jgi:hypothetical protein